MTSPLRIANASGFYGDRASAMYEQLTGGEIDAGRTPPCEAAF